MAGVSSIRFDVRLELETKQHVMQNTLFPILSKCRECGGDGAMEEEPATVLCASIMVALTLGQTSSS